MRFRRSAALAAVLTLFVGLWATTASATIRSLSGNARFQIGNGLPIPITLAAPPKGDVNATAAAQVDVTAGGNIVFTAANQMTHPGTKRTQGVFPANTAVFQVATQLAVGFPAAPGTLGAGLRSGPAVVTWCPGTAVPVAGAPACGVFPTGGAIPGGVRYTATGAQFGGPLRGTISGLATVALRVAGTPPGAVTGINAFASPTGLAAIGGPFNALISTVAAVPGSASGVFIGAANALGTITSVVASGLGAGVGNGATSYGAPWTTGRITASNLAAVPAEVFVLSGSDNRNASGVGTISLVSSAISARVLSGPNANRGWLNLTVHPVPGVPSVGIIGGAALLITLASIGARSQRRRTNASA